MPDDLEPEPLSLLTLSEIPAGRVKINSLGVITVDPEATYHMALKSTTPGSLKVVVNPLLLHAATLSAALYKLSLCLCSAKKQQDCTCMSSAPGDQLISLLPCLPDSQLQWAGPSPPADLSWGGGGESGDTELERSSYRYNPAALSTLHRHN